GTPERAESAGWVGMGGAGVAGGSRLLQYRNKIADATLRLEQARALAALCRRHRVPLIINDHLELALSVDAEGLHLGSEDGSVAEARARLGSGKLLGVSCYRLVENARDAASRGADYVAFGGFFPSRVKPGAVRAPLSLLGEAKRLQPLPVVAIGGITVENAPELITAGADSVAVISALFDGPDIKATAQRFNALFAKGR